MAGIFAMIASGVGGRSRMDLGDNEMAINRSKSGNHRRQSSFDKLMKMVSHGKVVTIELNRDKDEPCDVYSWFEITLTDVNVQSQTFDASIEIHVFWQDFSLPSVFPQYNSGIGFEIDENNLPIKMSEIFENQTQCRVRVGPEFDYIQDTSTIYMFFVVECTFVERMELHRFPLDRQFLNMEFNAYHGRSPTGNWNWTLKPGLDWVPQKYRERQYWVRMMSSFSGEYELLEPWIDFNIGTENEEITKAELGTPRVADISPNVKKGTHFQPQMSNTWDNVDDINNNKKNGSGPSTKDNNNNNKDNNNRLTVLIEDSNNNNNENENENENENDDDFASGLSLEPLIIMLRLNRRPHYYYGNILFPNFLIGMACGTTFIVDHTELADRLGVLITLMLASVAFRFVVSTMLPRVTYLTIMDGYLITSFILIIVLIFENTLVAIPGLFPHEWILVFDYFFGVAFYILWGFIHLLFVLTLIWPEFGRIAWNHMYDIDNNDESDKPIEANEFQYIKTNNQSDSCKEKYKQWKINQKNRNKNRKLNEPNNNNNNNSNDGYNNTKDYENNLNNSTKPTLIDDNSKEYKD